MVPQRGGRVMGIALLTLIGALALTLGWARPAARAAAHGDSATAGRLSAQRATDVGFPAIDPDYLYNQLSTMVTTYQAREAGYDTAQSNPTAGHDGFATYWQAEMLRNLDGYGATAVRDSFSIPGWQGRPATSPAFNVEVSVPGVTHPDQVVVIGCHYDGEASSTQSANDDGSGCAIELGVAHALGIYWRAHHLYPARTLRFVIFDAEEQGLYGSFHYMNQTVNGDQANIVTMINEEQNGIEYPLRFLGKLSNPLLPTTIFVTPLSNNDVYSDVSSFTPGQVQAITSFHAMEQGAAPAVFAAFRTLGYTSLTYRDDHNQPVNQQIFTPADLSHLSQGDDTIASSDQYPFALGGIPTATYIGNYSYYDRSPPPWSYPYDQPQDTIQLMNIFASGSEAPAPALKLSLALPGMLTTWTLAQPQALGFVAAPAGPVATISDVGVTAPGQEITLAAAGYDPTHPGASMSYAWSFGDGATTSGPTASHAWATAGEYQVTLKVTDSAGAITVAKSIHVTSATPNVPNPYVKYPQDGVPPANPAVTLPTASSSGSSTGVASPVVSGSKGLPGWLWVAIVALVILLSLGLIGFAVVRRRGPATPGGTALSGMTDAEAAARQKRERALQDLLRPPEQ